MQCRVPSAWAMSEADRPEDVYIRCSAGHFYTPWVDLLHFLSSRLHYFLIPLSLFLSIGTFSRPAQLQYGIAVAEKTGLQHAPPTFLCTPFFIGWIWLSWYYEASGNLENGKKYRAHRHVLFSTHSRKTPRGFLVDQFAHKKRAISKNKHGRKWA